MSEPSSVPVHVWVNTGPHWTGRSARRGLLTAWRPVTTPGQPGCWEGWVITAHTVPTGAGQEVSVDQGWLAQAHIRLAPTPPPG